MEPFNGLTLEGTSQPGLELGVDANRERVEHVMELLVQLGNLLERREDVKHLMYGGDLLSRTHVVGVDDDAEREAGEVRLPVEEIPYRGAKQVDELASRIGDLLHVSGRPRPAEPPAHRGRPTAC